MLVFLRSESSKPVQIRIYLHETPQKTKINMYKFAPSRPPLKALDRTNLHKFAPPRGRHPSEGPTGGGGCKFRVGLEPADSRRKKRQDSGTDSEKLQR